MQGSDVKLLLCCHQAFPPRVCVLGLVFIPYIYLPELAGKYTTVGKIKIALSIVVVTTLNIDLTYIRTSSSYNGDSLHRVLFFIEGPSDLVIFCSNEILRILHVF